MMNDTLSKRMAARKAGRQMLVRMVMVMCSLFLTAETYAQALIAAVPKSVEEMALRLLSVARTAPEVLHSGSELAGKAADVRSATQQKYPKIELQTSLGSASSELPNTAFSNINAGVTAGLRYTVFDGGRLAARTLAAESGFQTGEHRIRKTIEAVVFDAMTAHIQILRFELLMSVARNSERALREIETLEARKVVVGGAGITDSQVATTRLALSANKIFLFQSSLDEARNTFFALFGFIPEAGELPVARVPRAWLEVDSTRVVEEALYNNPEVAEANSTINQSQANASAERAARYPSVDLNVTKRYEFPGAVTAPARLGFVFTLSTGTAFEASARADKAAAQVHADQSKLAIVRRDVSQRALSAWRRTITGYQRELVLSQAAVGFAEVFKGRKRRSAAGRETTMVLLDAEVEENNVCIDWVNAIFDVRLSELRLVKEQGKLFPPQGADQIWASSFYQSDDYREVVQRQISAATQNPRDVAVPGQKRAETVNLGSVGRIYSFRIDGLKTVFAKIGENL